MHSQVFPTRSARGSVAGRLQPLQRAAMTAVPSQSLRFAMVILMAVVAFAWSMSAGAQSATGLAHGAAFARGHILVAPKSDVSDADAEAIFAASGGHTIGKLNGTTVHVVNVPPGNEQAMVKRLQNNPKIKFAEVDGVVQAAGTANDTYYSSEWHLPDVGAPTAWNYSTGKGVVIAILDTGVDGSHPDLATQMVPGWNFYANSSNTADTNGHGTAVAGTAAAATNNSIGVASVAGGAKIMPVVIANPSAYAYWSTVAQGITWAADHGARVENLSYVGASASSTIQSAASYLRSKGGVLYVAAGNTGAIDNTTPTNLMMVVSALQQGDTLASFSTYGSFVDISAPGNNIISTAWTGGYWNCWGTSFATPIVAATAALILSARPDFTANQVDSTLESTAKDLGAPGLDIYYGYGEVNAAGAVEAAIAAPKTVADTTPPTVSIASPTGGTVSGSVTISVNASDNVGVAKVSLAVNGTVIAADSTAPYQFTWNSTSVPNGSVKLAAIASDAAGNTATSAVVTVNVSNVTTSSADTTPPTASIASPTGGTVSGTVTVSVNASDNVGVTQVSLMVNGAIVASGNTAPYGLAWNTTTAGNGTVSLTAKAYDAAGNSTVSAPVSVNVSNGTSAAVAADTTPPVVKITSPANGSVIGTRNVSITASATDNSGAAGITQKLYIDGGLRTTVTGGSLGYTWNVKKVASGTHTIKVTATDAAGNVASTQIQVTR